MLCRISPRTVQVFSVLQAHNSKTRTYDTRKYNYSYYVQNGSSTDFSSIFCGGFWVTFHNHIRLTEWDYKYSKEGIGRIFRISKYFLQVQVQVQVQSSVNKCDLEPVTLFFPWHGWLVSWREKTPLILFAFCQMQNHWFLFQKRIVLN